MSFKGRKSDRIEIVIDNNNIEKVNYLTISYLKKQEADFDTNLSIYFKITGSFKKYI